MTRSALLRNILNAAADERVIEPVVRAALSQGDFAEFVIKVRKFEIRKPDGWFHPSEHGTWTVRQLVYYLQHYSEIPPKKPTASLVLALTQGHFWHDFIQELCLQKGVLNMKEVPLTDHALHRRGHADGRREQELVELKTASSRSFKYLQDLALLKKHHPGYYAQGQDYLDMSGEAYLRYFVMCMEYPYPMEEFLVPADEEFQFHQRRKYQEALEMADRNLIPDPCCNSGSALSRSCPVRSVCPRGDDV